MIVFRQYRHGSIITTILYDPRRDRYIEVRTHAQ